MYKYFVSYNFSSGNSFGFGHTETECSFLIKGIEDIRRVAADIEKTFGLRSVIIINFKLFDE